MRGLSPRKANAPDKMTRAQNANAAFRVVACAFDLARVDAAFVARCHGLTTEKVQEMIETERARRAANAR